ncbi:MAG TPA: H4MPT-linked C1 transfer pathway protein [Crenotrichaceae bacterium]|nr:H4MPT-linked C1 transfer pathway protein [Crenotrichaceae bacterium]
MRADIIGWDIGGAHLKVAHLTSDGLIKSAHQFVCPLWKGMNYLHAAIEAARHELGFQSLNQCQHSVTMTAELVDLFDDRDQGVNEILTLLGECIDPDRLWIFCGRDGLLAMNQITQIQYQVIASANWLATAMLIAERSQSGLLIDVGSTTTDIVAIENNQVISSAVSDYERLLTDELVYTGVVRTPVIAVSHYGYFQGDKVPLMAEVFATMADIYRIINELPAHADQGETADGKAKSSEASLSRLARMIGLDQHSAPMSDWVMLARYLRAKQLDTIKQAADKVLLTMTMTETGVTIIGAGVGRFLVRDVALQCELEYQDFTEIIHFETQDQNISYAADYAPAVAVACLLHKQLS